MTIFSDMVQSLFRPSVAALAISLATAIVTIDNSQHTVNLNTVDLASLGCGGLLGPVCAIRLF